MFNSNIYLIWKTYLMSALILLFVFTGHSFATENHSHAKTFSDPAVFTEVPGEWSSKPIKHMPKYQSVDLVVSLGQQSHPIFHELIPQYAKQHNLKIVVEHGTCA